MYEAKTVGDTFSDEYDPLQGKMKEDVARMQTSLLVTSQDPANGATAIKQITLLRIYHQMARIIRFIDLMDKIEDKLYIAIENKLDMMDYDDVDAVRQLFYIQTRLQENMIESHKLLAPYIDMSNTIADLSAIAADQISEYSETNQIASKSERDKVRNLAQSILAEIDQMDE